MATVLPGKFPLDTIPEVAIGVSLPFNGKGVFNSTYFTREQIKSNLINYFLTDRGERYLSPTFGGGIKNLLFEMISNNTLDNLEKRIQEELALYFPTVKVNSIEVNSLPKENIINVVLTYNVLNQSLDTIELNFNSDGI